MVTWLLCIFSALVGHVEAMLYGRLAAESFKRNEHIDFNILRYVVFGLPLLGAVVWAYSNSPVLLGAELLASAFCFPAAHDEAYNLSRLWIRRTMEIKGGPPKRLTWRNMFDGWALDKLALRLAWAEYEYGYQSPSTTATNDLGAAARTWYAAIGLSVLSSGWIYFLLR